MITLKKSKNSHGASTRKILIVLLVFLSTTLFTNVANASILTDFKDGLSSTFTFINKNIVGQIKKDFCKNYILSISNSEWKKEEFRTKLGKRVCTSYNASNISSEKTTQDIIQSLNGNSTVSDLETFGTSSINNPTPDVYVPNPITSGTDLDANQIINLTNIERKNNDSSFINLQYNSILKNIAAIRVKDMFANSYFEHNSPTGDNASKEATKNGYTYITIGENIALGNFDGSQGLLTAWMNSPGHRANILNKNYTEIGVYATKGMYKGQNVWIAAQIFGKPIAGCVSPNTNLKNKISNYKISAESILTNIKNIDAELKTLSTTDTQTYNSKVAERNTLAELYNNLATEIKISVAEYNKEAAAYNLCIKTL
ncbi:MAG: CAP domain-containing protein [bacterium]